GLAHPAPADDGQEHVTLVDGAADTLAEIDAEGYGVDVHEDVVATEVRMEPVVQPTGCPSAVIAAVRDENPGHLPPSRLQGRARVWLTQLRPMTAKSTSHWSTALRIRSRKSTPKGMASMSMKTLSRPKCAWSRSYSRPAVPALSSRR